MATPAWQKKEGKNPKGGLNAKGRASYNRETGGNLKAPTKKKEVKEESLFVLEWKAWEKDRNLVTILVKIDYLNHLEHGIVNLCIEKIF